MATSIREYCMDNLKTSLELITTGNGYENTIASVQRYSQHNQSYASLPMIVIVEGPEDSVDIPNPLTTNTLTVQGMLMTSQDEASAVATGTMLNTLLQDVKRAVKVDPTRGGYAVDSEVINNEPIEGSEDLPVVGFFFEVKITYRHSQTDPTVVG